MAINLKFKEPVLIIIVFFLALFIFSIGINNMSYSSPDEKRYVQSAKEMIETGDWITPRYHGRPRFQKPILFYWLAALSMSIFGKGWFGARLPSVICGAMTIILTYLLGRDISNRRTGLFSASLLAVSWIFFTYSRLSTPDMATLFFITLSLYIFAKLCFQPIEFRPRYLSLLFFISLALATLAKGPAGLCIPLIIVIIFTFKSTREPIFRKIDIFSGVLVLMLFVLPWLIMMYKTHGDIYIKHIWQVETVDRIETLWGGDSGIFYRTFKNFFRYSIMTFVLFLPPSIFLPGAAIDIVKNKNFKRADIFIYLWIFTVIIFYTFVGTKKTHYLLSLAPPLCIIIGKYITNIIEVKRGFLKFFVSFIIVALFIYIASFGYFLPSLNREDGLRILSEKILSLIKEEDIVGVGSHFISHNRLDSYLGINVKKVNVDISDPNEQIVASRGILTEFLNKKERVFCVITHQDYEDYIPDELKKDLFILAKGWYWKKPNQLKLDKRLLLSILKGDKGAFIKSVKNEIYLISNKP